MGRDRVKGEGRRVSEMWMVRMCVVLVVSVSCLSSNWAVRDGGGEGKQNAKAQIDADQKIQATPAA